MTLPHHRYITPCGWTWLGIIVLWITVALLVARCA